MGYLSDFIDGYLECALWSSTDNSDDSGGNPLDDNYGPEDFSPTSLKAARADCESFVDANRDDLVASGLDAGQAGHDFWLIRNGHGAGFWDRGLGEVGERLSDACKPYGSVDLYVHDGEVFGHE